MGGDFQTLVLATRAGELLLDSYSLAFSRGGYHKASHPLYTLVFMHTSVLQLMTRV